MTNSSTPVQLNFWVSQRRGGQYFAVVERIVPAPGLSPSGIVKNTRERFTDLSLTHPVGHYLGTLHRNGDYYHFAGALQVMVENLLLIPLTVIPRVAICLPMVLNSCIFSMVVLLKGSLSASPRVVTANFKLHCRDNKKFEFILPYPTQKLPVNRTTFWLKKLFDFNYNISFSTI